MIRFLLFCLLFFCCNYIAFTQTRLNVSGDAKVEGKLDLQATGNSIFIGRNSGQNDDGSNRQNVFIGHTAGQSNTTGQLNTFIGALSGRDNNMGFDNTFIGRASGLKNTSGVRNTYIGTVTGQENQIGSDNIAVGAFAGFNNLGSRNLFIGNYTGYNNNANDNIFIGHESGNNNDIGTSNTFLGIQTGRLNEIGTANTYIGFEAGEFNIEGSSNTAVGERAGKKNIDSYNTFIGSFAGVDHETGQRNTYLGFDAGHFSITDAWENTFIGSASGYRTEGDNNVFIGVSTGANVLSGNNNVYIGNSAGRNDTTGQANVFIGHHAGENETGSNLLYIENSNSSSPLLYGEFDNNKVQINGTLHVTEHLRLLPSEAPSSPEEGMMYYDSTDHQMKVWTGSMWEDMINTNSTNNLVDSKAEIQDLRAEVAELRSMLQLLLVQEDIVEERTNAPKRSLLAQNYPNPASGITTISYFIEQQFQNAHLQILSMNGRLLQQVRILKNGLGNVTIDLSNYSKGSYFYSLVIDGKIIITKQMICKNN